VGDILEGGVEALDEFVNPLILLHKFLKRAVEPRIVLVVRCGFRKPRRRLRGVRDDYAATPPERSAALVISCWQALQVKVCNSNSLPRVGCGVRLVSRIRFLHSGQAGVSVAPKRVGIKCSLFAHKEPICHLR
jgi:hypothetical protein